MRFLCWCFLLLLVCCDAAAQGNNVVNPGTDTAAINRYFHTGDHILNPDSAIIFCNKVLALSVAAHYADGAFLALISRGIKYYEKEDYVQYRNSTLEALPWAAKASQKDAVAWCYINIGEAYFSEADYILASEYYYTALNALKKATGDTPNHTAANIYNDLGIVNIRLNQPVKALAYFNQAEDIAQRGKLYYQLANSFIYKGEYYTNIHRPDSAAKYFRQVMEIGKTIGKVDLQAIASNNMGKMLIESGSYREAISCLDTAIALARNRFDYIVVDASYSLGDALYHMHKYKEAEAILDAALQESKAHNYKDNYSNLYTKLVAVYKATGEYQKAAGYMDTLAVLRDSLMSTEKAKAINLMEIKYKTAEKDKEIAQNLLLIAQQKNKIERKNTWIVVIGGLIVLLSIIAASLYSRARHKQRLQEEQIKSLQQANTIGILKGMVQGEEQERSRIARELHDGIGGMLSAAMMRFMAMRHHDQDITRSPAYTEAMGILNEMGDEIRKTAHNLMPDALLKQTLPEALLAYCNHVQEGNALEIDFQSYGSFDHLPQDLKLNIYRIVQELLKNIVQHAAAAHTLVQLLMHENTLAITVEDNGKGFDKRQVKDGMGLQNLQTRVKSLNGIYTLESEEAKGTTVYMEFDLKPQS